MTAVATRLTQSMLRELRSIERDGNASDPFDLAHVGSLCFVCRDRVIGALIKRELIAMHPESSGYSLTQAGRSTLKVQS